MVLPKGAPWSRSLWKLKGKFRCRKANEGSLTSLDMTFKTGRQFTVVDKEGWHTHCSFLLYCSLFVGSSDFKDGIKNLKNKCQIYYPITTQVQEKRQGGADHTSKTTCSPCVCATLSSQTRKRGNSGWLIAE